MMESENECCVRQLHYAKLSLAHQECETNKYKAMFYHAQNTIRQQQKGLKRLSAKIKRLRIIERGPFSVQRINSETYALDSSDFTHDVTITINGDFKNDQQRKAYVAEIVRRLNAKQLKERSDE